MTRTANTALEATNWAYRVSRVVCCTACRLWRVRGCGAENVPAEGPAIIACNHQSYLDPVLIGACTTRPLHYMARDTLFRNRAFAWLIRRCQAFPVKRGVADIGAFKEALRLLRNQHVILLFPEGTRSSDGRVARMNPGVIAIARRSRVAIIPAVVDGVFEAWPRDRRLPRWAPMYVQYGQPIPPEQLEPLDDAAAADLLTTAIRALQNDLRRRAGRPAFEYDNEAMKD